MKECIKDFCDKETKEKCDSFYKEAFLNRNELVRMLKEENKQLKWQLIQSEEVIEECIESIQNFMAHIDDGFCADMMTFIDILNKYKGVDENESNWII